MPYVENIGRTGELLIGELSGSKGTPMSRERIRDLFIQTVAWLRDVFSIIDENHLR
jgi:hypothetical protein